MGSASDHLANERTFLAYVRTALAFIAFGFVIARFAVYMREFSAVVRHPIAGSGVSVVFGAVMVFSGIIVAVFGTYRYANQMRALAEGRPDPLSLFAAVTTAALITVFGTIIAYVLFRV